MTPQQVGVRPPHPLAGEVRHFNIQVCEVSIYLLWEVRCCLLPVRRNNTLRYSQNCAENFRHSGIGDITLLHVGPREETRDLRVEDMRPCDTQQWIESGLRSPKLGKFKMSPWKGCRQHTLGRRKDSLSLTVLRVCPLGQLDSL